MKLCMKIFAIVIAAATTYAMIGCAAPPSFSYQNVSVSIATSCIDCAGGTPSSNNMIFNPAQPGVELMPYGTGEGGIVLLTATVKNAPSNVSWAVYPTATLTQPSPLPTSGSLPVGEANPAQGAGYFIVQSGNTAKYTGPPGVPYYTGAMLTQANSMQYTITYQVPGLSLSGTPIFTTVVNQVTGIPQGDALIAASVPDKPSDPSSVATGYQLMQFYNSSSGNPSLHLVPSTPSNPSGLTTSVLSVPVGEQYQFYGVAIGARPCIATSPGGLCSNGSPDFTADNGVIWEVGADPSSAVQGGSATYGTISSTGLYTAPSAVPPTQPVVVMAAHAAPASSVKAYITITQ